MLNELTRRLARLEKRELSEIPSQWLKEERGRYLWRLLRNKGVDPGRLFTVEYFPYRQCWLLTQEIEHGPHQRPIAPAPAGQAGLLFYNQVSTELRRTALAAFAAAAARSVHFARFGCNYQLPPKPQETTPADLVRLLGGPAAEEARIRFTSEGGWKIAQPEV
jgi:hypothetical protein